MDEHVDVAGAGDLRRRAA